MACCYTEECGQYSVGPMLVAPSYPSSCCDEPPMCSPCLPRCPKGVQYCCEKKRPRTPKHLRPYCSDHDECCDHECTDQPRNYECHNFRDYPDRLSSSSRQHCESPARRASLSPPLPAARSPPMPAPYSDICPTCSQPTCRPVKTKYVMPCYRYEDGRIVSLKLC